MVLICEFWGLVPECSLVTEPLLLRSLSTSARSGGIVESPGSFLMGERLKFCLPFGRSMVPVGRGCCPQPLSLGCNSVLIFLRKFQNCLLLHSLGSGGVWMDDDTASFSAFGLLSAGIKNVTQKFYVEVEDGNPDGHQGADARCGIHRGIGIHDTTTVHRGSIAIECVMKEVGVIKCPCSM